jgi:hypothetical protein
MCCPARESDPVLCLPPSPAREFEDLKGVSRPAIPSVLGALINLQLAIYLYSETVIGFGVIDNFSIKSRDSKVSQPLADRS